MSSRCKDPKVDDLLTHIPQTKHHRCNLPVQRVSGFRSNSRGERWYINVPKRKEIPIIAAVGHGYIEKVEFLLEHAASTDVANCKRWSALRRASEMRHQQPMRDAGFPQKIVRYTDFADITSGVNNVYYYDERAKGKYAEALCSLRLLYHLSTLQNGYNNGLTAPEINFSILDNCVGQNKSKAVLMFFALLSVVFPYKKVVLCYLLPGHSHNIADRVVAWCRRSTHGLNLYTPVTLVEKVNEVKSVNALFIDHKDSKHPFFVGWNSLLSKYFKPPPLGYTSNYLFEIDQGICIARKTVRTPDEESVTFQMISPETISAVRNAILCDLFVPSTHNIFETSIRSVRLPHHPLKELPEKEMKSLSAKYSSIPSQYLGCYPAVPDAIINAAQSNSDNLARKPDHPRKKRNKITSSQRPILQWFSAPGKPNASKSTSAK